MHVVFPVEFLHIGIVDKDQAYKDIDGSLLGKPKTKRESSNLNGIEGFYKENPAAIGNHSPDNQKKRHESHVLLPIFF